MGSFASRQNTGSEENDVIANQAYKYPPKSGTYFSNYFIMGGQKFDAPQPEAYLFGDNMDLNMLGNRPVSFPYPPPQNTDPTRPLKCLVNVRRESVRFVRANEQQKSLYNLEFTFDADVRCSITIHYFCTEEVTPTGITYVMKDDKLTSETYYYKRGANQQFVQTDHVFDPSLYADDDLFYNYEKDVIPIAIHCVALEGTDESRQSHTTIVVVEHHSDGSYSLKALKQKLFVDGIYYLLQEIYGIENKAVESNKETNEDEVEDGGLECVICMSDMRDTLILPCRHLCLCQGCADSLRYQANNCPICRSPFRALLQIKALQKIIDPPISCSESPDIIPPGFERISLIEALNGSTYIKQYAGEMSSTLDPLLDSADSASVICSAVLRAKGSEIITKSLKVKTNFARHKDNGNVNTATEEIPDEDSEAEKLSPLLDADVNNESPVITYKNETDDTDNSMCNNTDSSNNTNENENENE